MAEYLRLRKYLYAWDTQDKVWDSYYAVYSRGHGYLLTAAANEEQKWLCSFCNVQYNLGL